MAKTITAETVALVINTGVTVYFVTALTVNGEAITALTIAIVILMKEFTIGIFNLSFLFLQF